MPDRSRIPRVISKFNSYISNTNTYLLTGAAPNWTRMGLNNAEMSRWTAYTNEWSPLYSLYSNKQQTRTTSVKDQLWLVQKNFIAFAQPLLDRIASSPDTVVDDFEVFNIKRGSPMEYKRRTRSRTAIAETVMAGFRQLGGGYVKTVCRISHTSKRGSLPNRADSIMAAMQIGGMAPDNADVITLTRELIIYPCKFGNVIN